MRDEFLSEEDLDLRELDERELLAHWHAWLVAAQATNDLDRDLYSHGVFEREPAAARPASEPASRNGPERG